MTRLLLPSEPRPRDLDADLFEASSEVYGDAPDDYECLERNDCSDPGGHIWLGGLKDARCIHCGREPAP